MSEINLTLFEKHVPQEAVAYCFQLWKTSDFRFKITRKRNTKLGDYRFSPEKGHQITVNQNLNKYSFLITFLHEVAHYQVVTTYKKNKLPHGKEWKNRFAQLAAPVLNESIFPKEILNPLQLYMQNPKASSCSDPTLMNALRLFNTNEEKITLLADLQIGETFRLNRRVFRKGEKRRTRALCEELSSRKKYLISVMAEVETDLAS
ncbi:MAG: SprT-like domain-containing protein [Verrucomicrobia bacterium]|nr:SprT-like domain-containing protein [Cytophagales bacterium]